MADNDYIDLNSTQEAICLEDSTGIGKFFLPTITPLLSRDAPYDDEHLDIQVDTSNILSDINTKEITQCTESNYVVLTIPGDRIAYKGDRFAVTFMGGELNKPVLTQKL